MFAAASLRKIRGYFTQQQPVNASGQRTGHFIVKSGMRSKSNNRCRYCFIIGCDPGRGTVSGKSWAKTPGKSTMEFGDKCRKRRLETIPDLSKRARYHASRLVADVRGAHGRNLAPG